MNGTPGPPCRVLIRAARGVLATVITAPLLAIALALYAEAHISRRMMGVPWIYHIALRPGNTGRAAAEKAPQRQCP